VCVGSWVKDLRAAGTHEEGDRQQATGQAGRARRRAAHPAKASRPTHMVGGDTYASCQYIHARLASVRRACCIGFLSRTASWPKRSRESARYCTYTCGTPAGGLLVGANGDKRVAGSDLRLHFPRASAPPSPHSQQLCSAMQGSMLRGAARWKHHMAFQHDVDYLLLDMALEPTPSM